MDSDERRGFEQGPKPPSGAQPGQGEAPERSRRRGNRHHAFRRKNRARQAAQADGEDHGRAADFERSNDRDWPSEGGVRAAGERPADRARPTRDEPTAEGRTSAQMRGARPSGRTPGTRTAQEPATAPLGTDDEAAGAPARPQAVEHEIERAEKGAGMQGLTAEEAMHGRPGHPEESPSGFGKLVTIGAAIVILLVLAALLL